MKSFVLLCAVLWLRVTKADGTNDGTTDITDIEVYCKYQAYLQTVNLAEKIKNGTVDIENLTDVIVNYVACKYNQSDDAGTLESRYSDNTVDGTQTSAIIKCVLTHVLDMAKCIVNDELTGVMKWKWPPFLKCMMGWLPQLLKCVPLDS